ncbi:MAG: hypothetical protein PVF45_07455 [Anaerolineae bacterium]|jgi:hypothetical protein
MKIRFILLGLLLGALAACDAVGSDPTGTPPVVQMMPDLPGHKVVEGQTIQEYIATLAEGGTLLTGHPELAALIEHVDGVFSCYQDAGAVNARIYSDESFPLSSGAVAIADRNRLTDPQLLFRCVGGRVSPLTREATLDPCSHSYTLEKDDNAFYIIYIGTTADICHAFCEQLEDCSAH